MSNETVRSHWNKILQQLDIKIRTHDLRHLIGGTLVSKVREEVAAESLDDFFKRVR